MRSSAFFERAADVDRRGLHLARRVDELVEDVALDRLRVRVADQERVDAVERLAEVDVVVPAVRAGAAGVAAGEDAAVVAEDAVLAGAARDPVVAPAADQVVVLGVAVERRRCRSRCRRCRRRTRRGPRRGRRCRCSGSPSRRRVGRRRDVAEHVGSGVEQSPVASAPALLQQRALGAGREERGRAGSRGRRACSRAGARRGRRASRSGRRSRRRVVVVDEPDVPLVGRRRRRERAAVGADDPDDPAVVADDRVGVARVLLRGERAVGEGDVLVAVDLRAGAAEEQVGAVGPRSLPGTKPSDVQSKAGDRERPARRRAVRVGERR